MKKEKRKRDQIQQPPSATSSQIASSQTYPRHSHKAPSHNKLPLQRSKLPLLIIPKKKKFTLLLFHLPPIWSTFANFFIFTQHPHHPAPPSFSLIDANSTTLYSCSSSNPYSPSSTSSSSNSINAHRHVLTQNSPPIPTSRSPIKISIKSRYHLTIPQALSKLRSTAADYHLS